MRALDSLGRRAHVLHRAGQGHRTLKEKEKKILSGHSGPVYAVAFHPKDNKLIATASQDKTARVWDLSDGKMKVGTEGPHRHRA